LATPSGRRGDNSGCSGTFRTFRVPLESYGASPRNDVSRFRGTRFHSTGKADTKPPSPLIGYRPKHSHSVTSDGPESSSYPGQPTAEPIRGSGFALHHMDLLLLSHDSILYLTYIFLATVFIPARGSRTALNSPPCDWERRVRGLVITYYDVLGQASFVFGIVICCWL
jgi:hypothetical protein